jgi:predicted dinucleotide-binding enzyme
MRTWLRFHVSTVVVRFSPVAADARRGSLVALFPVRPVMLIAGDDPSKKPVVMSLVAKLGFEPVDAGSLRIARLLEPYGNLRPRLKPSLETVAYLARN